MGSSCFTQGIETALNYDIQKYAVAPQDVLRWRCLFKVDSTDVVYKLLQTAVGRVTTSLLHLAAKNNNFEAVQWLVSHGLHSKWFDCIDQAHQVTPLGFAFSECNLPMIEFMLTTLRADANQTFSSPLWVRFQLEILSILRCFYVFLSRLSLRL